MCRITVKNDGSAMFDFLKAKVPDIKIVGGIIVSDNHMLMINTLQEFHNRNEKNNGHKANVVPKRISCI